MVELIDFDEVNVVRGVFYGGNAGAKESVSFNNGVWMLKYPKTTRDLVNPQVSYTTSPISEYIGSKIYEILGIPVHETLLGVRKNKIVVACRDFQFDIGNIPRDDMGSFIKVDKLFFSFHDLKNNFMSSDIEEYSGTGSETLLDEVLATIKGQEELKLVNGTLERFWDMFVVDAFIGNNDRNNGNWGLTLDLANGYALAPVYDNGNAFFNKRGLTQMENRLNDESAMREDAYKTVTCVYKYKGLDNEGHKINPFEFIKRGENNECNAAVTRFVNAIDMGKISSMINKIPEVKGVLSVMPKIQKDFYIELLKLRFQFIKGEVVE